MCSTLAQKRWIVIVKWSRFSDSFWFIMYSDSLGIHVDLVKTQLRFIITALHKTQLNSNSTLPAEPVDSTWLRFAANKLGSIHLDSYFVNWIQFNSWTWIQLPIIAIYTARSAGYSITLVYILHPVFSISNLLMRKKIYW